MAVLSFHETKNVISGEGGALIINDSRFSERAEIIREKGTNRKSFFRGEVDKYSWVDIGSSYLPSELTAAFLWAQMENAHVITEKRRCIWNKYHGAFGELQDSGAIKRPSVPDECVHNGHMYYIVLPDLEARRTIIDNLNKAGIGAIFHYVPLDDSHAGKQYARKHGNLPVTRQMSDRVARLPLWTGMGEKDTDYVIEQTIVQIKRMLQKDGAC